MPSTTEEEIYRKASKLITQKPCFQEKGMPIERTLCPEMAKFWEETKFVFFKTWEDEKDYSKSFDNGFEVFEFDVERVETLPKNRAEFISLCVTNADWEVGLLYTDPDDRERFSFTRYQNYLEKYENRTIGETKKYYKFKNWAEYCNRRFKVPEENTYCRVMTGEIEPESYDFCAKR